MTPDGDLMGLLGLEEGAGLADGKGSASLYPWFMTDSVLMGLLVLGKGAGVIDGAVTGALLGRIKTKSIKSRICRWLSSVE